MENKNFYLKLERNILMFWVAVFFILFLLVLEKYQKLKMYYENLENAYLQQIKTRVIE